jgi:hypothetical protein
LLLDFGTLLAGLDKASGIAYRTARTPYSKISDDIDGEVAVNPYVSDIRASRQILNRAVDPATQDLLFLGMDRPDVTSVSHAIALANHLLGLRTAKNGNGTRFQKTLN